MTSAIELLAKHAELEEKLGDGDGGNFISGWQCVNPWHNLITAEIDERRRQLSDREYMYADRFSSLEESFVQLHASLDRTLPQRIIFGAGSTVLLLLAASWLSTKEKHEIYYVTPMYFTLHSALKILGIRCRPVNGLQPYEQEFSLNLPEDGGVLVVTDPVWYSGTKIANHTMEQIRIWQRSTNSLVVVDGSFQYMDWSHSDIELTATLDPSLTLRVVCPTKQLAVHGFRASYMLVPDSQYREVLTLHSHLFGSASIDTIAFLLAGANLLKQKFRYLLADYAHHRYVQLRAAGLITAPWQSNSGYFCFERFAKADSIPLLMDGSYFEQPRFPGFYRINLLSPQLKFLCHNIDIGFSIKLNELPA